MWKRVMTIIVVMSVGTALNGGVALGQVMPSPPAKTSKLTLKLDQYLSQLTSRDMFSGSVLVARGGQLVLHRGYGYADRGSRVRNTRHTTFRLAGLSALFAATAALRLSDQGKLSVHDLVCSYIDGCPEAWEGLTLQDMLTSSIHLYDPINQDPNFDHAQSSPLAIVTEAERHSPPTVLPSSPGSFCNTCMFVLEVIVAKVSGQTFGSFLEQDIIRPLHLQDTGMDAAEGGNPTLAVPYVQPGQRAPAWVLDDAWFAGMHSTTQDLHTLVTALAGGTYLSAQSRKAMFTVHHPAVDGSGQGFGWSIGSVAGRRVYGLDGSLPGAVSSVLYFPKDRIAIIVLDNEPTWDIDQIVAHIYATLFGYY